MEHVLLFAHKKYGFWVYPGGHAHSWDFRDEVLRELSEELGIRADHLISLTREAEGPAFLMKFYVSDGKCHSAEQEHVHFDAVFSYSLDSRARLMLNREEGLGYHWLPLRVLGQQETLAGLEIPKDTAFTIKKVMEQLSSF